MIMKKEGMDTGIKVGDIMTRNFVYVSSDTDLKKCARTMVKKRVGSLIIKDNGDLKGLLTEKDIIWAIVKKSKESLGKISVKDLMRRKVVTIKPSSDIIEALRRMKKKKIRRMPVLENGKVIGMVTMKDIMKIDPGLFEIIAETMKIKEETEKLKRGERVKTARKQGICDECGQFELLYRDDGVWICEGCYGNK